MLVFDALIVASYFGFGLWKELTFFMKWIVGIGLCGFFYHTFYIFFGKIYLDQEGLKLCRPFQKRRVITWENLRSIEKYRMNLDNPNWIDKKLFEYPIISVWVYHKNGKHIPITNSMNDCIELLERLIDECDKRGLGGKVDYRIREILWEYQDDKREEEEEWEEWEDDE